VRTPYLEHRLIEWAWQVPPALRTRDGKGKWLLRRVLERYVPAAMTERPKMGFGVPVGDWLRGPLRAWAEDLLSDASLGRSPMLDAPAIRRVWRRHLSRRANEQARLWPVLMFEAWRREWLP